jgi:hypothetical protein
MRSAERSAMRILSGLIALSAVVTSGCLERELKPLNPCLVSGVTARVDVNNIDKIDLLFIVDDSGSMREEQSALQAQFPKLITTLATGMRTPNDPMPFPPAEDVHLAVVSTDMGLVGINDIPGCFDLGKDGVMQHVAGPGTTGCQASYPTFLSYIAGAGQTPEQLAADFGCIAVLGTTGCGFEQQLEAGLKSLWPAVDVDPVTGEVHTPNRVQFLASTEQGKQGHGDNTNAGFLRNDYTQGLSLLAIIVVSDEEDCSSSTTRHFTPAKLLDPSDPLYSQDLNLRCYHNKAGQWPVQRYIDGFKKLRPDNEHLIIFAGIVGVPEDLVDADARANVDFEDETARNNYYNGILADPRMVEVPDPMRPVGQGNLTPSCIRTNSDGTPALAYPPRRFVEVAKGFGENGVIQSICQDNFGPAMDAIIEVIAKNLGAVCLPRPLVRKADGTVGCNVVWELPAPNAAAPPTTPRDCNGLPYLMVPEGGRDTETSEGGKVCTVFQLPVVGDAIPAGDGWYYDDFSLDVMTECSPDQRQRIAFGANSAPPTGVVVKLECLNETQVVANTRTDLRDAANAPSIGTPCSGIIGRDGNPVPPDQVCWLTLNDNTVDKSMFCNPSLNVCVRSCSSASDCPSAWECDKRPDTVLSTITPERPEGSPYCVNPTCGTE